LHRSPDRGRGQAQIAAAESSFQARPIATGKIYDHSGRMKEKRVLPKSKPSAAVGRSHTYIARIRYFIVPER